jgi:hypothetical protein
MSGFENEIIPVITKKEALEASSKIAKINRLIDIKVGDAINRWKYGYADLVMVKHKGNIAAACRELGISYRTMINWIHESKKLRTKSRGRIAALKELHNRE